MPLRNIREDFIYGLLPPTVADLDWRKLIQAVVGGFQDRVSDLRSYAGRLETLLDPDYVDQGVVLATFVTDGGVSTTVSLTPDATTPESGVELLEWSASQLGIESSRVSQAIRGSDALRVVTTDTLQLLAASIGATLYPGISGETASETETRRRQIVSTYFPRLKFKGTARSWQDAAKLHGFDDATWTPLWTRYAGTDGRAFADVLPGGVDYAPLDLNDGPWTRWSSGSLYSDPTSPAYFTSINGKNPLITLTVLGSVQPPPVGTYELAGGTPQLAASVRLTNGTVDSMLRADAVGFGNGFDRTRVVVTGQADWRQLSVAGWSSLIKFRSSTFDAAVFRTVEAAGTMVVGPNPSLRAGLALPDGTSTAPWRPWSGGSGAPLTQTLWPTKSAVYGVTVGTRVPADSYATQIDSSLLSRDAQSAFSSLDEVRLATRLPRQLSSGVLTYDTAGYRNYPGLVTLAVGPGAFAGTVSSASRPVPSIASLQVGGVDVATELDGSFSRFYDTASGSINNDTGVWAVSTQVAGTLIARFKPTDDSYLPPVSVSPLVVQRLDRPAGTTFTVAGTYSTADEAPWMRYRPLMTGGQTDLQVYDPTMGDPAAIAALPQVLAPTQTGRLSALRARDFASYPQPYRVTATQTEGDLSRPFKPAMASLSGTQYPVAAVHGLTVSSSVSTSLPRRENQRLWWWLGEDSTDKLQTTDLVTGNVAVVSAADPEQRQLDPARGWVLSGPGTIHSHSVEDIYPNLLVGGWFKPTLAGPVVRAGQVSLWTDGSSFKARAEIEPETYAETPRAVIGNAGTWTYAAAGISGGRLSLRVRHARNIWEEKSLALSGDPLESDPTVQLNLPTGAKASDVSVWSGGKTTSELGSITDLVHAPTKVAWPASAIDSLRGDRYGLTMTSAGQVLPGTTVPAIGAAMVQASVFRYNSSGSYIGDPEFKLVGLGQSAGLERSQFKLGRRGVFVPATGNHTIIGTNAPLAAYSQTWVGSLLNARYNVRPPYNSSGGVVGTTPSGSVTDVYGVNTVLDRIYLRGLSDGSFYQCQLDDFGNGPVFTVTEPVRFGANGEVRDQPTDHRASFISSDFSLAVVNNQVVMNDGAGGGFITRETVEGYVVTEFGSRIRVVDPAFGLADDFNMYLRSRQRVIVDNAEARWSNRPAGTALSAVPALEDAGRLVFTNTEQVAAGTVRVTCDIGNDGWLDDDFPGFEVEVSLDGPGAEPVSGQAVWMAGARGFNQTARCQIEIVLGTAMTGPWNLTLDWTNPRNLPTRGRRRRLQVFSYSVREVRSQLCRITLAPLSINVTDTSVAQTDLQAGAWVGKINQYGSVTGLVHETEVVSRNPDLDSIPRVAAADALSGSSTSRYSQLLVPVGDAPALPALPPLPAIISVGTSPAVGTYNVGDSTTLSAVATGDQLRYAWRLWSYGSFASYSPDVTGVFNRGGYSPWRLLAVDRLGRSAVAYGTIYVNNPPDFVVVTATPNNQPAPFATSLRAIVSDAESQPVTVTWRDQGSVVAVGTTIDGFIVRESRRLTVYAVDAAGGTSTADVPLVAGANQRPQVAISDFTPKAKANFNTTLKFSAIAQDPEGRGLSATWNWWDGLTSPGYAQPMRQFGNGTLFTVERQAAAPAGYQLFNVVVSDQDGLSSTAGAGVLFSKNNPPQISSATVSAPAVAVGDPLYLAANAVDPDGDTLSYVWSVNPVGIKLYGPNAVVPTNTLAVGSTISIRLTVDDGYGGIATVDLPAVTITAQGQTLKPITIDPASGPRASGAIVTIAYPDSTPVDIRYTIDGSTPFNATDGLPYSAPFMLDFTSGKTVSLKARAFAGTFAPSNVAEVTYTFAV